MELEALFDNIRSLPADEQGEVIDLVQYLRNRAEIEQREAREANATLDAIMADPVQRAVLLESVQRGTEEHLRGESFDLDEVFDTLLADLPT